MSTTGLAPRCSVVMPCRNEIRFIEHCLQSLVANDYPASRLDIIVVDGGSTDGTREILDRYAARHAHIAVLDNPNGVIPVSMNIGIRAARGAAVLKVDAHTVYPADYISRCVRHLFESGAANVGGVIETCAAGESAVARSIARVLAHPFGSGNSRFRIGSEGPIDADTVAFGCYRRDVLERMGGYNEALVRSSDMDLNNRIRRAGGRIVLIPDIVSRYYPRSAFWPFVARNWVDGFWATYPLRFGGEVLRPRHVAPLIALAVIVCAGALSWYAPAAAWASGALVGAYAAMLLAAAVQIGVRERAGGVALLAPAVFAGRHLAYACGSLWGLVQAFVPRGQVEGAGARAARPAARPHDDAWWTPFRGPEALSIVVPAFNEERRLPMAIDAIDRYLAARAVGYEIIVVDDGSTDRTAEIVADLAASRPALRCIRLPRNQGKGAAVKAGVLAASGQWIVFTDADQSTSVDQLPALLEPLLDGFDVAMGSRAMPDSVSLARQRWYRRVLARVFGMYTKSLLVRGFRDCQCGFKAFSRESAAAIFSRVTSPTAIFDMEVLLLSRRLGFRVAEVAVDWRHDPDSRLVYNVPRAVALFGELLRMRRHWGVVVAERAHVTEWTAVRAAAAGGHHGRPRNTDVVLHLSA